MTDGRFSDYEELKRRLAKAEGALKALREGQADMIASEKGALVVLLAEANTRAEHIKRVLLAIRNVNKLIVSEDDPLRLIDRACATLSEKMGYFNAWIALLDEGAEKAIAVAGAGLGGGFAEMRERLEAGEFVECLKRALRTDGIVVTKEPKTECPDCPLSCEHENRAGLASPLRHDGKTYGILTVSVPAAYAHDEEEQILFGELADDLSFALHKIEAANLLRESQKDFKLAQALAKIGSWRFDLNANTVIASEETRNVYGLDDSEWSIPRVQTVPLPQYRKALDEELRNLIADGEPYDIDFKIRRPSDGAIRHIHSMAEYDAERNIVVGTIQDITERKQAEEEIRRQSERLKALVDILQYRAESLQDFLDYALVKAIDLTRSKYGYIYFYDEETEEFVLNTWTKDVMEECSVANPQTRYQLEKTGIWGEAARQRRPIIVNDFQAPHPLKKGYPEGHVHLDRFLTVPVTQRGRIVAVVGVANKPSDYDEMNVLELSLFMDAIWKSAGILKGEQELRNRERYLQTILQTSAEGFLVLDEEGKVVEVNEAYCAISGYARDEILGMGIGDLDAYETPAETAVRIRRIVARGAELFETRHRRKDGGAWPLEISTTWMDENGGRFVCFCRDLTARKQKEERIELLGQMLDAAPACIAIHDEEGRFLFVNRLTVSLHGYDDEAEFRAINLHDLDVPESEALLEERFRLIAEKGEARFEVAHYRKDGSTFPLEVLAKSIEWDGRPAVLSIASDITERKRAEEELRSRENQLQKIFELLPIGLWLVDQDGTLLRGNPMGVKIWGAEPKVGMSDYGIFKAWRLPDREPVRPEDWALAKTIRDGATIVDELLEVEAFDGKKKTILNYTAPVVDDLGKIAGAIVVNLDVSDRMNLEAQLRQAQKMESVGRLAGGVAHDYNNMLSVILGHTEIALATVPPDSHLHEDLTAIYNAAMRSADITRQLLAFARKQTIAPKEIDLNETIAGMLKMLRRLIGEDIDLVWAPDADIRPVKMDPSQIDQILANLCVNARDAIGNTGKLTIETGKATFDEAYCAEHAGFKPGDFVMLAVSDDGCGMDRRILEHLFEPFFTTKDLDKGTGLGLATVYGIVKQNNGFINVYSEPGQGTTFRIYLPPHEPVAVKTMSEEAGSLSSGARGDETILIVEDEPAILRVTKMMLEQLGYKTLSARTPGEALNLAREHAGEIHLIVTDVVMPEMNGRYLARKLKDLYPKIKQLFMSGYTANVIAHHGVLDEGVQFIQKPFSMNDLADKVRLALSHE